MLAPKRVKFRKQQKGRMRGMATRGNTVAFGDYGLQAVEPGWITNRQIEAARVALTRHIKMARRAFDLAAAKLPVKCKFAASERAGGGHS